MADSPSRLGLRRAASNNKSYVDLTGDSDDDDIKVSPLRPSKKDNGPQKRKRAERTPTPEPREGSENEAEAELQLGEEEYEVEYIVDSRVRRVGSKHELEYFVHWAGYPKSERSWTVASEFDDDDRIVVDFYKANPTKPKKGDKAPGFGDLRHFFSKSTPKSTPEGKENKRQASPPAGVRQSPRRSRPVISCDTRRSSLVISKQEGQKSAPPTPKRPVIVIIKKGPVSPAKPKPKKRKVESDGSDFEFIMDDDKESDEDEADVDMRSEATAEAQGSGGVESDGEDLIADEKPAAKRQLGGWSTKGKTIKKPPVMLGPYRTGVKPLGQGQDVRTAVKNMSEELPPLSDIGLMFDHLVSRLPDITKLVQRLNGRKLRVATMCSGTESPLLALNMIAKAIKRQHKLTLGFEHVFSCEIEPFKQAYIERNFAPPILFRDVTELGKKRAHTAYGSLADVPGHADILIAGTSCVDYSNLNNQQQDIEANGESGRTFRGMLQWVKKHQPPIVILENVCSAPWDKVVEYFGQIDYDAQFARLDTKEYYIPHTRTRVYLFATPAKPGAKEHLAEKWAATVKDLRRPWSAPFEAFLLPTDDPNIHRARLDLSAAREQKDGTQRKATDWNRCESRHQRARQDELLGLSRPLTAWQEAGVCKGLDWTWPDWLKVQTERVVDLLEISTLRMAKDGIDSGFKACIWNVSQNVDRQTGSNKTALAPCLTPNMIPWVTNRGGPVTGREALALQGIPVRDLLLTSESEDQLADLAGNAMTTTVVGASMLAAFKVALEKLSTGENAERDAARLVEETATLDDEIQRRIVGEDKLETHDLDLAKVETADLQEILALAERSSRHCQCEGRSGTAPSIDQCTACGYRACRSCGGRPEHCYIPCPNVRAEPTEFEKRFKELLPMRVKLAGLTDISLSAVRNKAVQAGKGQVSNSDWDLWSVSVLANVNDAEFRFRYLKRQGTWTAVYEAPRATLDLILHKTAPEWRLTIKPPPNEPNNSRLRALLLHPVARLRIDLQGHDLLCGLWEICVPSRQTFKIEIAGQGEQVPSWHASLGLQGQFIGTTRWSELKVTVPEEAAKALDRDLNGVYTLLPNCGQAMSSLHKKQPAETDRERPDLFFFLDPSRCGEAHDDFYVFSTDTERLDFGIERPVIATLEPKYRESDRVSDKVSLNVRGGWIACPEAHVTAVGGGDIAVVPDTQDASVKRDSATYATPPSAEAVSASTEQATCEHAMAVLACKVPLDPSHSESIWKENKWGEIDLLHQGNETFANLAWITERIPTLDVASQWSQLVCLNATETACSRCAPKPPKIHWIKRAGKLNKVGGKTKATIFAYEDRLEAGRYEHALKNRPSPFVVQLRLDEATGSFRIGLNIVSIAHRALARLPITVGKGDIQLSWRLTPGQVADVPEPPRVFVMPGNKRDPQHSQPEGFLLDLRKEQLRSLWWMLEQERAEGKTHTFVEEEISEAALPALGWRAEGKAERPVMVRGGVIADQVGYGKTIISLALIAESRGRAAPEPEPESLIDLKATLIVVPGHLSKQWPSEIARFTGKMFKTIVIQDMRGLQQHSISDLAKADIIVVASEVFESDVYWERFEYLSASPEGWLDDKQGGRFFCDRLDSAMQSLRGQTQILKAEGGEAAASNLRVVQDTAKQEAESRATAHKAANFGKRMKGQAYRDKYDTAPAKKKAKLSTEELENWEASEDEDEDEETDPKDAMPAPTFRKATGTQSYSSSAVKGDMKLLAMPLLHMFRFRRVIADEFTYLERKSLAALLRLSSCYKWVLSGTPPVNDFPAIRSIAAFMGIHLGVEDDAEGSAQAQKARAKEQTQAERFHAFREVHSAAWHRRRDDLAQHFLDIFVRQNIAEIEDIPTVEHIHEIKLPAAEGAVYLELEHHLQALEMQARKETKFKNVTQGDRNARLEEALADSKTAEEALLKRCCHFTLDLTDPKRDAKSAQEACDHITGARKAQLTGCERDLTASITLAVELHLWIRSKGGFGKNDDDRQPFKEWVDFSFDPTKHQGDAEAARRLVAVLEKCGFEEGRFPTTLHGAKSARIDAKAKLVDVKWQLREQTHLLRKLAKELVARVRSLRFFDVVRKLQKNGPEALQVLEASACAHRPSTDPGVTMSVLSCCGHVSCYDCIIAAANSQRCVMGSDCAAAVRHTNIVKVSSLGIEGELSSGRYGAKLRKLVELIQSIPKLERVLVFLQFEDLLPKISEALSVGGIKHVKLSGSVKQRANTLDTFQSGDSDTARVLLLKINDASAAGSNLTTANHAIFLGPLFTNSLLNYRAVETQAIGRVRRYGQRDTVHVHRLLALDTIDTTIFEARRAELKAKPDYVEIPIEPYEGKKAAQKTVAEQDRIEVD